MSIFNQAPPGTLFKNKPPQFIFMARMRMMSSPQLMNVCSWAIVNFFIQWERIMNYVEIHNVDLFTTKGWEYFKIVGCDASAHRFKHESTVCATQTSSHVNATKTLSKCKNHSLEILIFTHETITLLFTTAQNVLLKTNVHDFQRVFENNERMLKLHQDVTCFLSQS